MRLLFRIFRMKLATKEILGAAIRNVTGNIVLGHRRRARKRKPWKACSRVVKVCPKYIENLEKVRQIRIRHIEHTSLSRKTYVARYQYSEYDNYSKWAAFRKSFDVSVEQPLDAQHEKAGTQQV